MIEKLEELRKHEDNLIFNENNIFLIAQTLLITAITNQGSTAKNLIVYTAIILSILWILLGIRHSALIKYYNKQIEDAYIPNRDSISSIHKKLNDWKKQDFWYTGHNIGITATNIRCIFIPAIFLIFWIYAKYSLCNALG